MTKTLQVEVDDELAARLEEWSKKKGQPLNALIAQALTLLQYAIDEKVELVKRDKESKQEVELIVT